LLWFYRSGAETRISTWEGSEELRERVIEAIAKRLGIAPEEVTGDPEQLEKLGLGSLELVELVMDLEERN
jgi:acyl carrier protein